MQKEEVYTVISATNRQDNKTLHFAEFCKDTLTDSGDKVGLFSLQDLPKDFQIQDIYEHEGSPLEGIVNKYILPADKFIIAIPEYNGSYPGILKVFIDSIPPKHFHGKKALLIGTSSGRAGNLRGMDHLTGVLHYLKVEVYSQKLPISSISDLMGLDGEIIDDNTKELIRQLLRDFRNF